MMMYLFEFCNVYFQYKDGEEVVLWVNTVGPYHNRQETYAYFSLPFCQGPKQYISHYHETLGEALQGTELEFSGLDIQFKSKYNIELHSSTISKKIKKGSIFIRPDFMSFLPSGLPIALQVRPGKGWQGL